VALSSAARASLRYRIARALLMASQIPTQQGFKFRKKIWLRAARWGPLRRLKEAGGATPGSSA
jgi:hypothetical protein